jgi:hypothetical protein
MRLTDAQLANGLRRIVPSEAQAGLRDRILAEVQDARQERSLPALLGRLTDADPVARRRALLLVAAALLAIGAAAASVVGSLLRDRQDPLLTDRPNQLPELAFAPPADMPGFVRSTYDLMPELRPVTVTTLENGTTKGKIYVDGSGSIRVETYASPDATEPETYKIFVGTTMGQLTVVNSEKVWYEQAGAISEDPRVFVFATMGAARRNTAPGCEVAVSPGEVYVDTPGRGWKYLGSEYVAGRPTHHVACGDELWIDTETRMTLRSRGGALTIEATDVEFGQPPPELFELRQPQGVAKISDEDYGCASDPYCSASPRPVVTPPPAPGNIEAPKDLTALLAAALVAGKDLPPYEVVVENWSAKYPGSGTHLWYDGAGRYRVERTFEETPDPPSITLRGPDYQYSTELTTDGVVFWRRTTLNEDSRRVSYPLRLPDQCVGGWTFVGVDLVHNRPADHLTCPGVLVPDGYWIDRQTHLVLRIQTLEEERSGTSVEEVAELRLVDQPPELFELPKDADVRQ